jgi:hypothetical protein
MTATQPRTITRLITEPSITELVAAYVDAQEDLANTRASARASIEAKAGALEIRKQNLTDRMTRDGIDAFTDRRTGKHFVIENRVTYEITDQDRVFSALNQRGRLGECTRLDVRAVKKEAKSAPLEGTTEIATRRLRVRKAKGA